MTCGIYCITNNINGKQYVGQSVDIEKRMSDHIHADSNSKIHQAIVKYGVQNFRFEPLIRCSPEELDEQEVKFIRLLGTYENGYNQTRGGQSHVFNIEYNYETYSELKETIKSKNTKIKVLKQKNYDLNSEVIDLKRRLKKLEETSETGIIGQLKSEHGIELTKYQKDLKNLQDEIDSLKNENKYLQKIVSSYTGSPENAPLREMQMENGGLKHDIRVLNKEIRALNNTLDEKDKEIQMKNRQIQILHERLGWQPKTDIYEMMGTLKEE